MLGKPKTCTQRSLNKIAQLQCPLLSRLCTAPSADSPTVTTVPPVPETWFPTSSSFNHQAGSKGREGTSVWLNPGTAGFSSKSSCLLLHKAKVLFPKEKPLHPKLKPPEINSVGKLISHSYEITANLMYQRTTSWKHRVLHLPHRPNFSQASSSYFEANVLI